MTDKCSACIIGHIGSDYIREGDWQKASDNFDQVIKDWNEKTKRYAVPHPGYVTKFNHCPACGHKIEE
ncbi:hypothetical protein [Morganella phage Mecenats66]|nr:hypothetical protein [Morganella phage Mecenats66]